MKFSFLLTALCIGTISVAQVESTKKGDIEYNGNRVVEMDKYNDLKEPSRFRARMVNVSSKDTLVNVHIKKEFESEWMQFHFKKQNKTVEVGTDDIIRGLSIQKSLGSFLVKSNLFDSTGNINEQALDAFAGKYNENLTEKYAKLNEGNRLIAATKFDFVCDGGKIYVNGKQVGTAYLPDGQQTDFRGIVYRDMEGKIIVSGDGGMGGSLFKTFDGKELKLGALTGRTIDCGDKRIMGTSLLREFFRAGYFRN